MEVIDPATGSALLSRRKHIGLPDFAGGYLFGITFKGSMFAEGIQHR
jgi:hypothetical protein